MTNWTSYSNSDATKPVDVEKLGADINNRQTFAFSNTGEYCFACLFINVGLNIPQKNKIPIFKYSCSFRITKTIPSKKKASNLHIKKVIFIQEQFCEVSIQLSVAFLS